MSGKFEGFPKSTFKFLQELKNNNNRDWFKENKSRYEADVLEPSLEFIESMSSTLKKVSPYFLAVSKRTGGSLIRIYRDTRFSKDKTPYKTNIGIHFRHEFGKDVHAPGFYIHLEPKECFFGAGIWRPDSVALKKIRSQIVDACARYRRISRSKKLLSEFDFSGDSLKRSPRDFDPEHPLIDELKRKDFFVISEIPQKHVYSNALNETAGEKMARSMPLIRFLCDALRLPS